MLSWKNAIRCGGAGKSLNAYIQRHHGADAGRRKSRRQDLSARQ